MTQPSSQSFTLNDLATVKNIIEVASTRGAFKADELATVGAIYNKVTAFLTSAQTVSDATIGGTDAATKGAE